ncbi:MAG: 1-acyl-sn-glycerol-3-phosphate acyltransferase [Actinomycetota bacterium]|nr:1-acyl-sn-glycerol-3-phosphate acyltransferase [Actinomycetota bacterium]
MGSSPFLYRLLEITLSPMLWRLYRVKCEGLENFPVEGGVIVAANHVSFMDSFFIPLVLPRRVVYLAKAEYFESWKTAWFVKALGMIPVKRGVRSQAEAALRSGVEVLEAGGVLGLYPEGTRSPDGRLYRGRTGVARLALRSGAPVVPVGLVGSRKVMPKGARLPKLWGDVTVKIGTPMTFEKYKGQEDDRQVLRTITDEIMARILALSGQKYVDQYAGKRASGVSPEDFRIPGEEMLG